MEAAGMEETAETGDTIKKEGLTEGVVMTEMADDIKKAMQASLQRRMDTTC